MAKRYSGLRFSEEDIARIDEALALLEALYGFRPSSRAELVRIAVKELLEAKKKERAERLQEGAILKRDPSKKASDR